MASFPRTMIGNISVSRMVIGSNWFMGCSHVTAAKDEYICEHIKNRKTIADIMEVFVRAGIDTVMTCLTSHPIMVEAIQETEDRTGSRMIAISTPAFKLTPNGVDWDEAERLLDKQASLGSKILMPHQSTTDTLLDRLIRKIRDMDKLCAMIRERGMEPGLSTHMPEAITIADRTDLDVSTYISMYNAMGFLMQVEVDWVSRLIQRAKKPVITIKPMAAGHIRPFQALTFVWNTIRDQDMVTVGTMSPREAEECIELSCSILEQRTSTVSLQETRSKRVLKESMQ